MDLLVGIYLSLCSFYDLKNKELPNCILYLGVVFFTLITAFRMDSLAIFLVYLLLSSLPALLFAVFNILNMGIGDADAFIIYSIGLAYGLRFTVFIIIMASMAVFLYGTGFVKLKKGNQMKEIPFIPFLLISTMIFFYLKF